MVVVAGIFIPIVDTLLQGHLRQSFSCIIVATEIARILFRSIKNPLLHVFHSATIVRDFNCKMVEPAVDISFLEFSSKLAGLLGIAEKEVSFHMLDFSLLFAPSRSSQVLAGNVLLADFFGLVLAESAVSEHNHGCGVISVNLAASSVAPVLAVIARFICLWSHNALVKLCLNQLLFQ